MKISDALEIIKRAPQEAKTFEVALACGFTPLHLETFLSAYLQRALPNRHVRIKTGSYGDLINSVDKFADGKVHNLVIVVEWEDLDPRLSYRSSVRWEVDTGSDILSCVQTSLNRLRSSLDGLSGSTRVVASLPTLALPPIFHTAGWQISESEALLNQIISQFATQLTGFGIHVVNASRLAEDSAPAKRYDFKSDLLFGLPYTLAHADSLASTLACLLCPPAPKKGIITDLDDTLWSGLVGETGPEGVHWDIANHSGLHGCYQSLLASLSQRGILIGVASKNDATVVKEAFQRADILLRSAQVFPMEIHWGAKSASVDRILRTWKVDAESVIFIDDSAMELEEVAAAHPGIECIQFPKKDYPSGYDMLRRIRDFCGKSALSQEDYIRLDSIRKSTTVFQADTASPSEQFLQEANAVVRFEDDLAKDPRAFELVNKTNQFNLNGIRYSESDWMSELSRPEARSMALVYEDRFGLLGKVAVMLGQLDGDSLTVNSWVMSCRSFGRRIEYLCLKECFERYQPRQIKLRVVRTRKNIPLQEFLTGLSGGRLDAPVVLTRERFEQNCPALYHTIIDNRRTQTDGSNGKQALKVF